jgi:hypothetical protein
MLASIDVPENGHDGVLLRRKGSGGWAEVYEKLGVKASSFVLAEVLQNVTTSRGVPSK